MEKLLTGAVVVGIIHVHFISWPPSVSATCFRDQGGQKDGLIEFIER